MKKLWVLLGVIVILLGILFTATGFKDIFYYSPCDNPVTYNIGYIDPKFNLSRGDFLADTIEAATQWNKAEGKTLLAFDPNSKFTINMIYDVRQSLNNQINSLDNKVQNEKSNLNPQIDQYNQMVADFQTRMKNLNDQIAYWNQKGGAPSDEYDKLIAEQQSLKHEANKINVLGAQLNQSSDQINSQVSQLNSTIDQYNATLQVRPEEGLYKPVENTIDIYFNNGQRELVHTLEHELGHALGLEHLNNPTAIMYYQTNNTIVPAQDDITALDNVCKKRSVFEIFAARLSYIINFYKQQLDSSQTKTK